MKTFLTIAAVLLGTAAQAAPVSQANSGIADLDVLLDFNDGRVADGDDVSTEYQSDFGVRFDPNLFMGSFLDGKSNMTGGHLTNFKFNDQGQVEYVDPFSIYFDAAVTDALFHFRTGNKDTTFTALLGGTVIESFSVVTDTSTSNVYGFTSSLFDQILIDIAPNPGAGLDNLAFSPAPAPVPLPASAFLLLAGLGGLRLLRRA